MGCTSSDLDGRIDEKFQVREMQNHLQRSIIELQGDLGKLESSVRKAGSAGYALVANSTNIQCKAIFF